MPDEMAGMIAAQEALNEARATLGTAYQSIGTDTAKSTAHLVLLACSSLADALGALIDPLPDQPEPKPRDRVDVVVNRSDGTTTVYEVMRAKPDEYDMINGIAVIRKGLLAHTEPCAVIGSDIPVCSEVPFIDGCRNCIANATRLVIQRDVPAVALDDVLALIDAQSEATDFITAYGIVGCDALSHLRAALTEDR